MPATYTDQFYFIDVIAPPPPGTPLSVSVLSLIDQNDNGSAGQGQGDTINGSLITASYPNDTVTMNVASTGPVTYVGATFYLANGEVVFTPTDGQVLQPGTFVSGTAAPAEAAISASDFGPPCFVAGTLIATLDGPKAVETLTCSDGILDHKGKTLSLRLLLNRHLRTGELARNPKLHPVRIMAGALGHGLPKRDLLVSRQHRVLLTTKVAERMFGQPEVLIPAIKLTSLPGIFVDETLESVTYYHILFDRHEVIMSEGLPTESLFTGPEAIKSISAEAREEIIAIFPEMQHVDYQPTPAFYIPTGRDQRAFIAQYAQSEHVS